MIKSELTDGFAVEAGSAFEVNRVHTLTEVGVTLYVFAASEIERPDFTALITFVLNSCS